MPTLNVVVHVSKGTTIKKSYDWAEKRGIEMAYDNEMSGGTGRGPAGTAQTSGSHVHCFCQRCDTVGRLMCCGCGGLQPSQTISNAPCENLDRLLTEKEMFQCVNFSEIAKAQDLKTASILKAEYEKRFVPDWLPDVRAILKEHNEAVETLKARVAAECPYYTLRTRVEVKR